MTKNPELERKYRQPTVFGPLPGPRNVPEDKRHLAGRLDTTVITVTARTEAAALEALLPPRCRLAGEPMVTVSIAYLSNIGWLAGRGYNILSVSFRLSFEGEADRVTGRFIPVLWESLADPIITGREELGFAKLYAEIPPPVALGDAYHGTAQWQGFRFFEMAATGLVEAAIEAPRAAAGEGSFHHRFMPKVGAQGEAEAEYLALLPGDGGPGSTGITKRLAGAGSFRFLPARWEDVPFQYPVINALAALPLFGFQGATVTFSSARGGSAAGGAAPMRRLR